MSSRPRRSVARSVALCLAASAALALRPADARADSDAQLWLEADVGHELTKTWSIAFEQHLRFDENLSRLAQVLPDLSVTARLHRALRLIAGYRLQYVRNTVGDFELRHRLYGGGQAKLDHGALRLTARALFTEQIRPSSKNEFRLGLRTRATAEWRKARWKPRLSTELFYDLDATSALDKVRIGLSVARELGSVELSLGYLVEVPVQDTTEPTLHVLTLGSAFEL